MTLFLSNVRAEEGTPLIFDREVTVADKEDMAAAAQYVHMMCKKQGYSRASGTPWEWADCLFGDVDGGVPIYEFARRYAGYEYYLVTSRSHQIEKHGKTEDRYHVYFPVEKIDDPELYLKFMNILSSAEGFDKNVKDINRQFFGSAHPKVLCNGGAPITELLYRDFDSHVGDSVCETKPMAQMREGDGRNSRLFGMVRALVAKGRNVCEIVDEARVWNSKQAQPLDEDELNGLVHSGFLGGLPKEAAKLLAAEKAIRGPYIDERIYTAKEISDMVKTEIMERDKRASKISTGFHDFNDALGGGFMSGDFGVVAAFTSDGKSTLLMNFGIRAAKDGYRVGILSLEDDLIRLGGRIASHMCGEPQSVIFDPPNNEKLSNKILNGLDSFSKLNVFSNHSPGMFVDDVERLAERLINDHAIDMLIVDYLQLLRIKGDKEIRERVGDIVVRLTSLAKFHKIVLLTASQLNRAGADNPNLTNLSESSKIEHQADQVFIITSQIVESNDGGTLRRPNAIKLVKNRRGIKNVMVKVVLDGDSMTFREQS